MSLDISEWLRGLGLGQYEPAFRDNDIDGELLLSLTAEDLRDLGVMSIGHRHRRGRGGKGMRSNLIPGGVMSAAGLVAFNRAQEHGYTSCYIPEE